MVEMTPTNPQTSAAHPERRSALEIERDALARIYARALQRAQEHDPQEKGPGDLMPRTQAKSDSSRKGERDGSV